MQKKLYRSPKDGILLGISSGIGHYFEKDPVLIRIIIVVLAFITNVWPVILVYGVLFLIIPLDPAQAKVSANQEPRDVTGEQESEKAEEQEGPEPAEEKSDGTHDTTDDLDSVERMDSSQNM